LRKKVERNQKKKGIKSFWLERREALIIHPTSINKTKIIFLRTSTYIKTKKHQETKRITLHFVPPQSPFKACEGGGGIGTPAAGPNAGENDLTSSPCGMLGFIIGDGVLAIYGFTPPGRICAG
jgi:hypothetical protein